MLYGTLVFYDAMAKPKNLDSRSCDWTYPIQARSSNYLLSSTREIRHCYRSKRVSIAHMFDSGNIDGINANIFLHNANDLIPGAVRLYLWRPRQTMPDVPYDVFPVQIGDEDFLEMVCHTRTITKGMAIGTVAVDSAFTEFQVVVLQPCSGVSVYLSPAGLVRGPTVGPSVSVLNEAPLADDFDYGSEIL